MLEARPGLGRGVRHQYVLPHCELTLDPPVPRAPQAQAQFWKQRCAKETKVCVGNRDSLYPTLERDVQSIKVERVMQLESRIDEERQERLELAGELAALKATMVARGLVD